MSQNKAEVWLRGPLANIQPLLQPVAHALLQVREELNDLMTGFSDELLWERPAGVASPGFHLQHLVGVLNRLFTYARGEILSQQQLEYLAAEGKEVQNTITCKTMVKLFNYQIDKCIYELSMIEEDALLEVRGVGREQIPSTVIGLLVHAAEHSTRHYGQLLVTVMVLKNK